MHASGVMYNRTFEIGTCVICLRGCHSYLCFVQASLHAWTTLLRCSSPVMLSAAVTDEKSRFLCLASTPSGHKVDESLLYEYVPQRNASQSDQSSTQPAKRARKNPASAPQTPENHSSPVGGSSGAGAAFVVGSHGPNSAVHMRMLTAEALARLCSHLQHVVSKVSSCVKHATVFGFRGYTGPWHGEGSCRVKELMTLSINVPTCLFFMEAWHVCSTACQGIQL